MAWSPDGTQLATASDWDGTVHLWDPTTGTQLTTLNGYSGFGVAGSVAWSPDGTLATGGEDSTIRLWDPPRRNRRSPAVKPVWKHKMEVDLGADVRFLAYSPDGRQLAIGTTEGYTAVLATHGTPGVARRLLALPAGGWAVFESDHKYRIHGDPAGRFWWSSGLCRFEPGELDGHATERLR